MATQRSPSGEMPPPGTMQCTCGMMIEVLAPGVQHGGDADVGAEVLGIGRDGGQRLGRGREQQAVDLGLVLVGDGADRGRQREHHVEVGNRQQLGLARLEPRLSRRPLALGAVPVAAGVIGDARVRAVLAALDMTAERGGAADLDRGHDAPLGEAQMRLLAARQAAPWRRKISATSSFGRDMAGASVRRCRSMFRSSSGLWICRIVLTATRA